MGQKEEIAWKKIPPKTGGSHKKKVNGKEYYFYIHHNAWTVHEGKDCHLKKEQEDASTIPNIAKTQVSFAYQANIPLSGDPNIIKSFQAILNKLLLE